MVERSREELAREIDFLQKRIRELEKSDTERKAAEEALRESEARYKALFAGAVEGVAAADFETKQFRYVNPAMCRMFGYTEEELIRLGVADIHPKGSLGYVQAEFEAQLRGEKTLTHDLPCMRKDGATFYVNVNAAPMVLDGHNCLVGFFTDITKLKAAEGALKESEERYRILYESSRDAIMTLDPPDWRFTAGNPATVKMFRARDEAEFTSKAPWQLSPEFQPDGEPSSTKAKRMIDTAMERGSNFFEWMHRRVDGEDFPATVLLTRIEIKGRAFLQATVRDIAERKAAEEKIAGLHKQIEFILGATKTGLDIIDEDFNIVFVDPEWKKTYGEYAGRKCYDYFMGRHSKCPACGITQAFATKQPFISEETLARENNRPIQVTTIPFQDENGRWLVAEVNVDITERKRAEEELARAQDDLNRAKRLSDIGALAATVAHELRNPMGVIRTAIYNVKRKAKDASLDKHLDRIEKKVLESDIIINNLLFYARIKMPHYEKVDICKLLSESVSESKNRYKEQDVVINEKYDKIKDVAIDADPYQAREVFDNILNNAYEAMVKKSGRIDIAASIDKDKEEVHISFKDNGAGIDPKDMQRIKDPFFTTKAKGVGLGLTVCYQIIGLHGGSILVESVKGKGSKFTVSIPVKRGGGRSRDRA